MLRLDWAWIRLTATAFVACTFSACGSGSKYNSGSNTSPQPPVQTYSITASVSGLTSSGLVLQNNGGGNVNVATGATSVTIVSAEFIFNQNTQSGNFREASEGVVPVNGIVSATLNLTAPAANDPITHREIRLWSADSFNRGIATIWINS